MTKNKVEFVESYIKKLNNCLNDCKSGLKTQSDLSDVIVEIINVFKSEIPDIEYGILLNDSTLETDTNSIIGKLKLKVMNESIDDVQSLEDDFENDLYLLNIEFNGIKAIITKCTDSVDIINYINKLEIAIKHKKIIGIKYCLKSMLNWYELNISEIYILDRDINMQNKNKIEEFVKVFEKYPDNFKPEIIFKDDTTDSKNNDLQKAKDDNMNKNNPIIFLSHKSNDKDYADALRDFIIELGVKREQLIYSSHPQHKIPLDKNIYDYLRENINKNIFMIILWSNEYLESPACLNEMGAVWVTRGDYTNIYVPSFDFGNPKYHECAVDTRKMGAVLNGNQNCKISMYELKNKIQKLFNLENDEMNSQYIIDKFIERIKELENGKTKDAHAK